MKRKRCRYCGVSDPAGLRFDRSYLGESNYVCRSIESCVERLKRFAKRTLPVLGLAEPLQASDVDPGNTTHTRSGEARESNSSRDNSPDSRGGQNTFNNLPVSVLTEPHLATVVGSGQETPAGCGELRENTESQKLEVLSGSKELRQVRDTSEGGESPTCCGLGNRHEESAPAQKQFAAGNGAQGDPATAGSSVSGGKCSVWDLPPHATARGISFSDKQLHNLLALGL